MMLIACCDIFFYSLNVSATSYLPLGLPVEGPSGVPGLDLDAPLPEVVGHLLLAHARKRVQVFQELLQTLQIDNLCPLHCM